MGAGNDRRRKRQGPQRDRVVSLRLTDTERQALRHRAAAEGITLSDLLRRVVTRTAAPCTPVVLDAPGGNWPPIATGTLSADHATVFTWI